MHLHRLSYREIAHSYLSRRFIDDILATIDTKRLLEIRDEEVAKSDRRLIDFKYFNFRPWVKENVKRALSLGLHKVSYKRVLDISTGFGLFPYVGEFMQHYTYTLDQPGHDLYDRITKVLNVTKCHHLVEPYRHLPQYSKKFDYVTAYQIAFNNPGIAGTWGSSEWAFFIDDVVANHLEPGGLLHLELNWSRKVKGWYTIDTKRLLKSYGARLHQNQIDIFKARD